jgi:hypothetical protein
LASGVSPASRVSALNRQPGAALAALAIGGAGDSQPPVPNSDPTRNGPNIIPGLWEHPSERCLIAVCSCPSQATVSRYCSRRAGTGLAKYTHGQTGLGMHDRLDLTKALHRLQCLIDLLQAVAIGEHVREAETLPVILEEL